MEVVKVGGSGDSNIVEWLEQRCLKQGTPVRVVRDTYRVARSRVLYDVVGSSSEGIHACIEVCILIRLCTLCEFQLPIAAPPLLAPNTSYEALLPVTLRS